MRAHQRRWPASLAVVAVIALEFLLPAQVVPPWWPVLFALEVLLLLPLIAANPVRLTRDHPVLRWFGVGLSVLLLAANAARLAQLVLVLLHHQAITAAELVGAGAIIWTTNVVAVAVAYWELDRGGAFARDPAQDREQREIDLLFPQLAGDQRDWQPSFVDYLFVAFTSATAFSPTDTMPLTARAKLLMMAAATVSLVTIAGVAARAVSIV